jgi:hypothetical protein
MLHAYNEQQWFVVSGANYYIANKLENLIDHKTTFQK